MTESTNSARIIDLDAYRLKRRQQASEAVIGPQQNAAGNPSFGGAMPLLWFWPTWVWVAVPVPAVSAVQWDAS
ncbi:hypothetical protein [Bradyrhizobium arachidis]|uniref:Uncharacterized protein n=1 Tax=Bradyrhizobium arachidis TaxID=858423 RepID=A0AAE7NNC3_9BRAD|nr:hypothetical protein [Bradyrhizobium arachidis]QOZ67370.1 hypothetical protein WN72_14415 [Bradyrhizobium arachidis]SFU80649.1 hypothetical protein SAMN05192541_10595 [Bradyrhizobium arachidis]